MDIFLKRMTLLQVEPQAGASGFFLKGSIAIIGDDSSMHVIVSEDLPVGKDVDMGVSEIDYPDPL